MDMSFIYPFNIEVIKMFDDYEYLLILLEKCTIDYFNLNSKMTLRDR